MNSTGCPDQGHGVTGWCRALSSSASLTQEHSTPRSPQVSVSTHCVLSTDRVSTDFPVYDPGTAGCVFQGETSLLCSLSRTGSLASRNPLESWLLPLVKTRIT